MLDPALFVKSRRGQAGLEGRGVDVTRELEQFAVPRTGAAA